MRSFETARAELLAQFGDRVRECRAAAKLTQEMVAAAADVRQPYVAGIEGGAINPTLVTIAKIASALGVMIRDLM